MLIIQKLLNKEPYEPIISLFIKVVKLNCITETLVFITTYLLLVVEEE